MQHSSRFTATRAEEEMTEASKKRKRVEIDDARAHESPTEHSFWLGLINGHLLFWILEKCVTIPRKAIIPWFCVYSALVFLSLWYHRPFSEVFYSGRRVNRLAPMAFGVVMSLCLQRLVMVAGAACSLAFSWIEDWAMIRTELLTGFILPASLLCLLIVIERNELEKVVTTGSSQANNQTGSAVTPSRNRSVRSSSSVT